MIRTLIAAAVLSVSFAAPSHAWFLPSGVMFSANYDYVIRGGETRPTNPNSLRAVKTRLFSIGDDNLGEGGAV